MRSLLSILFMLVLCVCVTAQNTYTLTRIDKFGYGAITASAWSNDGRMVAIGMSEEIRIYHDASQSDPIIIPGQKMVRVLAFRQDNHILASSDSTGLVRLWDTSTGEDLGIWGVENVGTVSDLSFVADTEILAINFFDLRELISGPTLGSGIRFWEYKTAHESVVFPTSSYRSERLMTLNADHSLIATATSDSQQGSGLPIARLLVRDAVKGEILQQLSEVRPVFRQLVLARLIQIC